MLFNRYLHPDIDLEHLELALELELSTPGELRLPLHWIGILRSQLSASLVGTSGVHSGSDVLKLLLAGADVAKIASALLQRGPHYLSTILDEIRSWLEQVVDLLDLRLGTIIALESFAEAICSAATTAILLRGLLTNSNVWYSSFLAALSVSFVAIVPPFYLNGISDSDDLQRSLLFFEVSQLVVASGVSSALLDLRLGGYRLSKRPRAHLMRTSSPH